MLKHHSTTSRFEICMIGNLNSSWHRIVFCDLVNTRHTENTLQFHNILYIISIYFYILYTYMIFLYWLIRLLSYYWLIRLLLSLAWSRVTTAIKDQVLFAGGFRAGLVSNSIIFQYSNNIQIIPFKSLRREKEFFLPQFLPISSCAAHYEKYLLPKTTLSNIYEKIWC